MAMDTSSSLLVDWASIIISLFDEGIIEAIEGMKKTSSSRYNDNRPSFKIIMYEDNNYWFDLYNSFQSSNMSVLCTICILFRYHVCHLRMN